VRVVLWERAGEARNGVVLLGELTWLAGEVSVRGEGDVANKECVAVLVA
jgi:hypothetical protein